MNVKLQNLVGKPLWLQLNSGKTIDISPTRPAVEVPRSEYDANPRIRKLEARGVIRVLDLPRETPPQRRARTPASASAGKGATKKASAEEKKQE